MTGERERERMCEEETYGGKAEGGSEVRRLGRKTWNRLGKEKLRRGSESI